LTPQEIARAVAFVGVTFGLGVVFVGGLALAASPAAAATALHVGPGVARGAGLFCLAAVGAYLALVVRRRAPLRVRGVELPLPTLPLALGQLVVAALDWALAAAVLRALLPAVPGLSFGTVLAAFLLAQAAGIASHVPGGLGVFEAVFVLLLGSAVPAPPVVGALVAYRAIYYLAPFAAAVVTLGVSELRRRRARVAAAAGLLARWVPAALPTALAAGTFAAGVVLLASGATPSLHHRVRALHAVLPLGVLELSHFLGSMSGAALLVLAWALQRRLDAARVLACALLALGVVASLLKGLDWEEALVLAGVLALLLASRHAFYRRSALTAEAVSPGWVAAAVVAVGVTTWLGLFSYRHVRYRDELWWHFAARGDAPRFLRATVGAFGVLLVAAVARLLRHASPAPAHPSSPELDRAAAIAASAPTTNGYLALLGDKSLLFSDGSAAGSAAFLMYGVEGRSWVALGDPVGCPDQRAALAWRFKELADEHGGWPVFYEASAEALPAYVDLGLSFLKLGEEARVPLAAFALDTPGRRGLRRVLRQLERERVAFELLPRDAVPLLLPELRRVSDEWLAEKRVREKGFSLGRFDEAYLRRFPVAVARAAGGDVVAFANVLATAGGEELSADLMRHTAAAPHGVMDFLFAHLMLWGRERGYAWFNLGMAPLSGLAARRLAPGWAHVEHWLYRHGEHFYNFQGLRQYKAKFDPVWTPKYLASPGGLARPRVLANVAALIGGGLRGVVAR
jgi:phosphatidylglycerol lysyltransferase